MHCVLPFLNVFNAIYPCNTWFYIIPLGNFNVGQVFLLLFGSVSYKACQKPVFVLYLEVIFL